MTHQSARGPAAPLPLCCAPPPKTHSVSAPSHPYPVQPLKAPAPSSPPNPCPVLRLMARTSAHTSRASAHPQGPPLGPCPPDLLLRSASRCLVTPMVPAPSCPQGPCPPPGPLPLPLAARRPQPLHLPVLRPGPCQKAPAAIVQACTAPAWARWMRPAPTHQLNPSKVPWQLCPWHACPRAACPLVCPFKAPAPSHRAGMP